MTKLLTKTSPLTLKILKLVKGLNKFTLDDIQRILPNEEYEIISSLKELEEESIIKQISKTEYLFVNIKVPEPKHHKTMDYMGKTVSGEWLTIEDVCKITGEEPRTVRYKCKTKQYESVAETEGKFKVYFIKASSVNSTGNIPNDLGITFTQQEIDDLLKDIENYKKISIDTVLKAPTDCEYYEICSDSTKKLLIKHLVLFQIVGNLTIAEAKTVLSHISKKAPYYKMNAQWYRIKYKRFKKEGLPGLYHNNVLESKNTAYKEFKSIYLSQKGYSQKEAYEVLLTKLDKNQIPSLMVLSHKLRKEYSPEAMRAIKSVAAKRGRKPKQKSQYHIKKIKFETALNSYMNEIKNNIGIEKRSTKLYCTILLKHFKDYTLGSITDSDIRKYKESLINSGFTLNTAKCILSLLLQIMIHSGLSVRKYLFWKEQKKVELLSTNEITTILNTNTPEAWVIGTGLKLKELEVLEYEDINYESKTLKISKLRHQEKERFYSVRQTRYVKVPSKLIAELDKNKTGLIFENISIQNYEQLIFAHVMLMQIKHVPMNLIAKNMGINGVHTFYNLFGQVFPQKLDDNFDLLEDI